MKTDSLIDLLARGAGPAPRALPARRLWTAATVGLAASAGAAVTWLGIVPAALFATPVPWMKLAYAVALALAAGRLTERLSRPAAPTARARRATAAVIAGMAAAGLASLASTASGERLDAVLGDSWLQCPWRVLALSLPALGATLWAVRGLAPTRPRATGFAAGLLAGALGAIGYALSCPESSAAFVATWYTAGIALTGAVGAAVGPRLLRW